MTLHKSLVTGGKLTKTRNVLTRAEKLERLKEDGRYIDGDPVYGLPKVRTVAAKVGKAKKKKEEKDDKKKK
ncbi:MAG: small basic protein [Planctomycetota bacterium]